MPTASPSAPAKPAPPEASLSFQVVLISPDHYKHAQAFSEVTETLVHGLRALGAEVTEAVNRLVLPGPRAIIVGANLLTPHEAPLLPDDVIVYNLEQIKEGTAWCSPSYLQLLSRCHVWDYSARNIASLRALGVSGQMTHLPIGYVPQLTRIPKRADQDIDVLFYGSINERRAKSISLLEQAGLRVKTVFGAYGKERDDLISRAKVVLNLHYYDTSIFELVRVSYLLANKKAVVAEHNTTTEVEPDIRDSVCFAPQGGLVAACRELVADPLLRADLEQRGFERMSQRDEVSYLRTALGPILRAPSDDPSPRPRLAVTTVRAGDTFALERLAEGSKRARSAGQAHLCPLVATAQEASEPLTRRASAAALAWQTYRDRRARAVLRCLLPGLPAEDLSSVVAAMSPDAVADLDRGPFVWSITPFFNELDVLEARLNEMARAVDRFVIVEASETFRGEPKPLYFRENRGLFSRWSTQLDHCVVELPGSRDAWERERHQRNIGQVLLTELGAAPDDLVLLTDLDEIVKADQVGRILEATRSTPVILMMTQYWYSLEWRQEEPWLHPKAFRFGQVARSTTYHEVRHTVFPVVPAAGWHFSWFGGQARFDYKLRSFSHQEYDTPQRREKAYQDGLMTRGVDIHGRRLRRSADVLPASITAVLGAKGSS